MASTDYTQLVVLIHGPGGEVRDTRPSRRREGNHAVQSRRIRGVLSV